MPWTATVTSVALDPENNAQCIVTLSITDGTTTLTRVFGPEVADVPTITKYAQQIVNDVSAMPSTTKTVPPAAAGMVGQKFTASAVAGPKS